MLDMAGIRVKNTSKNCYNIIRLGFKERCKIGWYGCVAVLIENHI